MPNGDRPKIIVLDDDPTGSQAVHSCPLLLSWDLETLQRGLLQDSPLCFILTNTRSCSPQQAAAITHEVCQNLNQVLHHLDLPHWLLISRCDSTLRGHFPLEPRVIAEELGPFDAQFLVPAFLEGGRFTRGGTHYVQLGPTVLPVQETEFARDPSFGFRNGYLPAYIEEKTGGQVSATSVLELKPGQSSLNQIIPELSGGRWVVVDAESHRDLDRVAAALWLGVQRGKRYLLRSAASLIRALAQQPPQPIPAQAMGKLCRPGKPGLFLVGSYTERTTAQLTILRQDPDVVGLELQLTPLLTDGDYLTTVQAKLHDLLRQGYIPVVYTQREPCRVEDPLGFGAQVGDRLSELLRNLTPDIGFLVCKGGNTSHCMLRQAFELSQVNLLGQILPGVCVVQPETSSSTASALPIVLFPGNVGEPADLRQVKQIMIGPGLFTNR
jgi:uncharacterized protein YgbK (DUF1537 family)